MHLAILSLHWQSSLARPAWPPSPLRLAILRSERGEKGERARASTREREREMSVRKSYEQVLKVLAAGLRYEQEALEVLAAGSE